MLGKNTLRLAVGEIGSRVPLLVLEVTLARLLGPAVYGLWSIVQTFATYGNFLHFGVSSSLARREPMLIERGEREEVRARRAAAFGFQILVVTIVALALLIAARAFPYLLESVGGVEIALALLCVILVQQITITTQASALNEYRMMASSIARLVFAFAFLFLGLWVARFEAAIFWLTLSWALALIIALAVLQFIARGILVRPRIDWQRTLPMLSDGFPIMLQGLLRFGLMSVDKMAVFAVARPEAVGFYGIGALGASVTGLLGAMVARVSLPTLLRLRARGGADVHMQTEFTRMMRLIQTLTFAAIFVICALSPLLVHFVLPEYDPAVRVIGILAIAGGFTGLAQALSDVSMSFGVKAAVLLNTVFTLLVEVTLLAVAWIAFAKIEAMALAVLCAMFLMCGRAFWLGMRAVGFPKSAAKVGLVNLTLRAIVGVGLCFAVIELQVYCVDRLNTDVVPAMVLNSFLLVLISVSMMVIFLKLRNISSQG